MTLNDHVIVEMYPFLNDGWWFDSHHEIFSLLDGKKVVRQLGSQEPTRRKVGSKPHPAPRGFLSKVGPMGSNSCRISRC